MRKFMVHVFSKNGHNKNYTLYTLTSLCYVESLSWIRLQFFELWPFKKTSQFLKNTLYYSPCFFPKNGSEITPNFYYIFWYILMPLCYVESLSWIRLQFFELWPFKKTSQFLKNTLYYSPCFFPKNGSEITQNFYYVFRYTLMSLCYVESLSRFRAQIFELWPFLKMSQFLKISLYYSPCFFPKNGSEITQNFYYIFRYTLMSLCYVESLSRFRAQIFELWPFLKMSQFLKVSLYYSPWFFPKNDSEITQNFYYIFRYTLMSLCYVESLSWFWLQIFELWPFLKMSQFLKVSLYYSPCFFPKNGSEIIQNFYYIFRYTLMSLCYVESLSRFRAQIFELWPFFKMSQFLKNTLYYSPCFFPKNGSKNHPKFLLHFLIHIDVLMLCRKFELILTKSFWVMSI